MGDFLNYDNWDKPGEKFEMEFTEMQWSLVKYFAYERKMSVRQFILTLIENEMYDPKLIEPKLIQPSLFDKNNTPE